MLALLNTNFIHNILNMIIILQGALMILGCEFNPDGTAVCAQEWISPRIAVMIASLSGLLKMVMNITRDGLGGLIKNQPPVADNVVTFVAPVNKAAFGVPINVKASIIASKRTSHKTAA